MSNNFRSALQATYRASLRKGQCHGSRLVREQSLMLATQADSLACQLNFIEREHLDILLGTDQLKRILVSSAIYLHRSYQSCLFQASIKFETSSLRVYHSPSDAAILCGKFNRTIKQHFVMS